MYDIDAVLKVSYFNVTQINKIFEFMFDVLSKLSSKYHDFQNVFDQSKVDKLLSYQLYNYKIIIESESQLS